MTSGSTGTDTDAPAAGRSGTGDIVTGLVVAGGGAILLVSALGIEEPARPSPGIGPDTVPVTLAALLMVSGLVLTVLGLQHRRQVGIEGLLTFGSEEEEEEVDELLHGEMPPVPWRRLLVVTGLFVGYAVVFIPLGYLLSTGLFLTGITCLVDRERWRRNLLFAIAFAVVIYVAFTELLRVQLPAGLLG
jgi:putative tricarboxylic transport membrane protein